MYFQENTEGEDQFLAADRRGKKRKREERERSAYVISAIWQHTSDTRKRKWSVLYMCVCGKQKCACHSGVEGSGGQKSSISTIEIGFLPKLFEKRKRKLAG